MLLVFCEIANQIDKSDEMPGNIYAARRQQPAAKPAPVPSPASAPPPPLTHRMAGRYAARPDPRGTATTTTSTPASNNSINARKYGAKYMTDATGPIHPLHPLDRLIPRSSHKCVIGTAG